MFKTVCHVKLLNTHLRKEVFYALRNFSRRLSVNWSDSVIRTSRLSVVYRIRKSHVLLNSRAGRNVYTSSTLFAEEEDEEKKGKKENKALMKFTDFDNMQNKSKDSFLELIRMYEGRHPQRRGHVEFIYVAMKHMDAFGVSKDLAVYKTLIEVLPKGKFIPTNIWQQCFQHYPKQQQVAIDLLEKMEDNGVIPDAEMQPMLLNIFGNKGYPLRKYWRMMYWMPKFKNLSPWPVPKPPPQGLELAILAINRICVDLQNKVDVLQASDVDDSIDKTWIVSGQSPEQRRLLDAHSENQALIVEGGSRVWLRDASVNYFVLKTDPVTRPDIPPPDKDDVSRLEVPYFNPNPPAVVRTLHEQDDGTILGVCATGTSSKDSLLSWIRLLQENGNPKLATIPVLFRFRKVTGEVIPFVEDLQTQDQ